MAVKTFADDEQTLLNEQPPKSSLTRVAVLAVACSFVLGSVAGTVVHRGDHPCGNTRRAPSTRRWPGNRRDSPSTEEEKLSGP